MPPGNSRFYGQATGFYTSRCDFLHIDAGYSAGYGHLAENSIISSLFNAVETRLQPKGLALKYVAEGLETYWLEGKKHRVCDGKYLLVNETVQTLDVLVKDRGTLGMCVNIDPDLVTEMLCQLLYPERLETAEALSGYLLSPELFVRAAKAGRQMQYLLNQLIGEALKGNSEAPAIELIYELVYLIVQENLGLIKAYARLQTAKIATRKELFHRLLLGKEMLDDSIFSPVNMRQVADESCLSEFRFYRLFRQCFQISPFHYLFRRRIEKSLELRKQGMGWKEIAYLLNFADLPAFSKAFKKIKGVSPSKFKC